MLTIWRDCHRGVSTLSSKFEEILRNCGLSDWRTVRSVEPLTGGVSSDIYKVTLAGRVVCVKSALAQLKTEERWCAPVHRTFAEYRWLSFAAAQSRGCVPQVLGYDSVNHAIVMEYLAAGDNTTWKERLLAGDVSKPFAAEVGVRLSLIHAASFREPAFLKEMDHAEDFRALRVEPYLRFTAEREPAAAVQILHVAKHLEDARCTLIHGDVSPKNILCSGYGPMFIDAECATHGDPAFDVAFCLNHLLIKAQHLPACAGALKAAAGVLWQSYAAGIDWEAPENLERRVAALVPALMLARISGKSRLEYLLPATARLVREQALESLTSPPGALSDLIRPDK
ncbi:putative aminoglycoside phosphotransferase [Steroidobacter agaridevorans]|uniref:Putative aminoglycoside phosphotransferase n=1 Tax=Steroidobacter agaridevorans TaxID=2695856 RepID=A0A829Y9E7_9GAMM|nr:MULTISPECIES: aminoglycoside phosphotransferase family protein [Steroidobacteraceae]GFE79212.1 putative aminoglycoside phosphotransferase [Steroidobacter agaridevorans]GFE87253.1 putative aminoglycoside phosphotransferase [Steroidobacter agaridevorans]